MSLTAEQHDALRRLADDGDGRVSPSAFIGADELRANVPPEPDWILGGYIAPSALTVLGKKPKAGGSTLSLAIAEAVASDTPTFLGRAIKGGPVVYVSEEASATLAHKIAATGRIRVLPRDRAWPKPSWSEVVNSSITEAERVGAVLVVIDTFAFWAQLARDAEKDAGAMQHAMGLVLEATRDGLAFLLDVHTRKSGGEDGDALRGSGAIAGAADIVLELERAQQPTQRVLLALSRYPSTPGSLVIDYDRATGAWAAIAEGERTDSRSMRDRLAIVAALEGDDELTRKELEEAVGAPERQWHAALDALIEDGQVARTGAGKKGDPYRFMKVRKDSAQDAAQDVRRNATSEGLFSAAHPFRDAAETNSTAETPNPAQCAESDTSLAGWTLDELESAAASFADEEAASS